MLVTAVMLLAPPPVSAASGFSPQPQYAYGQTFVALCEGAGWFIDTVETLLNQEEKSINTLQSRDELRHIVSIAAHAGEQKLPAAIGELTELKSVFLADNNFSAIPGAFYTLEHLEIIDLSHNRFTEPIPAGFSPANFPALKVLLLWDNAFSGAIPEAFYQFAALENLDLSLNQLSGSISAQVGNLSRLKLLDASRNQLSGEIPAAFSACLDLEALILWDNSFSGAIPDVFGALPELKILDLSGNDLTGALPQNLPATLRKLAVRQNRLTGAIPAAYSALTELRTLDLYHNALSGTIPVGFSSLRQLEKFDLSENTLAGSIPDIFSLMDQLAILNVSGNRLTGYAPPSMLDAQNHGAFVSIARNYLTGAVARGIAANVDNFIDGAALWQNQMYIPEYIQILENQEADIYQRLEHREAGDLNIITAKAKLEPGAYILEFNLSAAEQQRLLDYYQVLSLNELATIRADASGWYIYVHRALETEYPLAFILRMADNGTSDYSRTLFKVTSQTPPIPASFPAAGGGGGVGAGLTSPLMSVTPAPVRVPPLQEKRFRFLYGYPDGSVQADQPLTREEAAKMLFTALAPTVTFLYNGQYPDVEKERWSAAAIGHLTEASVLTGYPDARFYPTRWMSRAEFATLISRQGRISPPETDSAAPEIFSDISGHWAEAYILALHDKGLIQGYPDGGFHPEGAVTRAEAVAIICRLLSRYPAPGTLPPNLYNDLTPEHWAYRDILEASQGEEFLPGAVDPAPDTGPEQEARLETYQADDAEGGLNG